MPSQSLPFGEIVVDNTQPNKAEAYKLLHRAVSIVCPIMKARKYTIGRLTEIQYLDKKGEWAPLQGLNHRKGKKIEILLRGPKGDFLPLESIVDTFLHELVHNKHGHHDEKFWALYKDHLKDFSKLPGYENFLRVHEGDKVCADLMGGQFRNPMVTHGGFFKKEKDYRLQDTVMDGNTCCCTTMDDKIATMKPIYEPRVHSGRRGTAHGAKSGQTNQVKLSPETLALQIKHDKYGKAIASYRPKSSHGTAVRDFAPTTQGSSSRGRSKTVSGPSSRYGSSSNYGPPSGHGTSSGDGPSNDGRLHGAKVKFHWFHRPTLELF